jgi:choline-sulfatase
MIRVGVWKLVWYPKIDRLQLFDLKADPHELHDLTEQANQPERIAPLRTKLMAWLKEHGDPLATPVLAP